MRTRYTARAHPPIFFVALFALWLCACAEVSGEQTPGTSSANKPNVVFLKPDDKANFVANARVFVDARARDESGILRLDLFDNGVVVQTEPLNIASLEYEFQTNWTSSAIGQHTLTVVAYNVNGIASDLVSRTISISPPPADQSLPLLPTATPFYLVVTATPRPSATPSLTPRVIIVSATPRPTPTLTPSPFVIIVTATPPPTKAPTTAASRTLTPTH